MPSNKRTRDLSQASPKDPTITQILEAVYREAAFEYYDGPIYDEGERMTIAEASHKLTRVVEEAKRKTRINVRANIRYQLKLQGIDPKVIGYYRKERPNRIKTTVAAEVEFIDKQVRSTK